MDKRSILRSFIYEIKSKLNSKVSTGKLDKLEECTNAILKIIDNESEKLFLIKNEKMLSRNSELSKENEKLKLELKALSVKYKKLKTTLEDAEKLKNDLFKDKRILKQLNEKLSTDLIVSQQDLIELQRKFIEKGVNNNGCI